MQPAPRNSSHGFSCQSGEICHGRSICGVQPASWTRVSKHGETETFKRFVHGHFLPSNRRPLTVRYRVTSDVCVHLPDTGGCWEMSREKQTDENDERWTASSSPGLKTGATRSPDSNEVSSSTGASRRAFSKRHAGASARLPKPAQTLPLI